MQMFSILLVIAGLVVSACSDPGGPPTPATATLVVSTSTQGDDPDTDGYSLSIDDADSLHLNSKGTAEVNLASGRHTLRLLGVAGRCSVAPGIELEVDLQTASTVSVAFDVTCPGTGVRITVATTGLDLDPDDYRLLVDGGDGGAIRSKSALFLRLEPGTQTIALAGVAPNCSADGPTTVTVVSGEVTPVAFAVICTATSGVITIALSGSGVGAQFEVVVDGGSPSPFQVDEEGRGYVRGVPPGAHVISLASPANCSVETDPQLVTLTAGSLVRDTAEVAFTVTCMTVVRVSASTTGAIPTARYSVWLCVINDSYFCTYGPRTRLGFVDPNGVLVAELTPGIHRFYLGDLPRGCAVVVHSRTGTRNPTGPIRFPPGLSTDVTFLVECTP